MLILRRSETQGLLHLSDVIPAVERAFELHGQGQSLQARRFHVAAPGDGIFHVVTGGPAPEQGDATLGIKANGHFHAPDGTLRVSGAIVLLDARAGPPVAVLDAAVVTGLRTAAVTAVAARHLGREDARSVLVIGAGRQAPGQIDALAEVLELERVTVYSRDPARAEAVAAHARERGLAAGTTSDPRRAAATSDIVVTITSAGEPLLFDDDVPPGCLVAALGADGPGKQELDPQLLAGSRVVADHVVQTAAAGELRSAIAAGAMTEADVHAELGEIVAGVKPGRTSDDERFVFDSTGTALQDVAAASLLVEAARAESRGLEIDLGS